MLFTPKEIGLRISRSRQAVFEPGNEGTTTRMPPTRYSVAHEQALPFR
jgi:hypothetical protein